MYSYTITNRLGTQVQHTPSRWFYSHESCFFTANLHKRLLPNPYDLEINLLPRIYTVKIPTKYSFIYYLMINHFYTRFWLAVIKQCKGCQIDKNRRLITFCNRYTDLDSENQATLDLHLNGCLQPLDRLIDLYFIRRLC